MLEDKNFLSTIYNWKGYGHPFSRTVVDIFTTHAIAELGDHIIDIGSKYHKISKIMGKD